MNVKSKITALLFFAGVLVLQSCGSSEEEQAFARTDIIQRDSLLNLLVDLHLTDAAAKQGVFENNANNYTKYRHFKGVLELHEISKARFDSTLTVYTRYPQQFESLYYEVIERLKTMENARDPSLLE